MATQAQPLRMYHLPREVLDLIIQYVLRDTLLELGVAYDVHSPEFDEIVRANNKHLADLDDGLTLLLKLKPGPLSRDLLLRHATFCVRNVGIGNNFGRLNVLRYLQVTRQQYDILLRRFRRTAAFWEAFGEGGGALRTLTVCEVMRAGANSSTMRSVGYRLRSDRGLRRLASGFNGMFDDIVGFDAEGREICAPGLHRCRVVLRLRIETVVPVVLTYCEAEISQGVLLHFEAASDGEAWKRVLVDGLGLRGTSGLPECRPEAVEGHAPGEVSKSNSITIKTPM